MNDLIQSVRLEAQWTHNRIYKYVTVIACFLEDLNICEYLVSSMTFIQIHTLY